MINETHVYSILENDCNYYINLLKNCKKGHFLLRGYDYKIDNLKSFDHPFLENRKPKNMSVDLHNKINNFFLPIFKWKIRNGIFCYGFDMLNNTPRDDYGYGINYLFFPIDEFEFVYSKEHFDLWALFETSKESPDFIINKLKFENKNFCDMMEPRKNYHYFSNEISIKATKYYLVNRNFTKYLIDRIWD